MFYNIIGIIFSTMGTILTLWTVFITKDAGTWGELAKRKDEFPKEKKRVIIGCGMIIIGAILQIISTVVS